MSFTQDLFTSRRNYSDGNTRIGQAGRIWYDSESKSFKIGDGVNVGGSSIGLSQIHAAGVGLTVNQHIGNVTVSTNATALAIPGTVVSRDNINRSYIDNLISNVVVVTGNLTVLGNTKFVDQTLLSIQNKTLILANTAPAPSDFAANGGGFILLGTSNHTILWDEVTDSWESSENLNIFSGREYRINQQSVITDSTVFPNQTYVSMAPNSIDTFISHTTGTSTVRNTLVVDKDFIAKGLTFLYNNTSANVINANYIYTQGNVSVGGNLDVKGTSKFGNLILYDIDTINRANIGSDLTVNRNAAIVGHTVITGNTSMSGVLTVTGSVIFQNNLSVKHSDVLSANVLTTLSVIGATSLSTVSAGAAAFASATVANVLTVGNSIIVPVLNSASANIKAANILNNFSVGGTSTFSGTVAAGLVTVSNLNSTGSLSVGGNIAVAVNKFFIDSMSGSATSQGSLMLAGNITVSGGVINTNTNSMNFVPTSTATEISASIGTTTVKNNLITSGDITLGGGYLYASTPLVFVFPGTTNVNAFTGATALILAAPSGTTTIQNNTSVLGSTNIQIDLNVGGSNLTTSSTTFNLVNAVATTVNLAGAATTVNIGSAGTAGQMRIRNDLLVIDGNLETRGGNLTTDKTVFNLINSTATSVNFAGAATLTIGALTGTSVLRHNLSVQGNVLSTTQTNFDLLNSSASVINFAQAATNLIMSATTGTTRIRNNVNINGDLNIDGGDLTATGSTFNLLNSSISTINFGSAASSVNIGHSLGLGTTAILNDIYIAGNMTVNGTSVTYNSAVATVADPVLLLGGTPPALADDNKDRGIQYTWHTGTASGSAHSRIGFFGWDDSAQAFTCIPEATNTGEVFNGVAGNAVFSSITGTIGTFSSNITVAGTVNANGGIIRSSQSNFTFLDTVSTINMGSAATTINIGANTGSLNLNNSQINMNSALAVNGSALTSTSAVFNLINNPATVNFAQGATALTMGAVTGTVTVRNDLEIQGGTLKTNLASFNLLNSTVSVINAFGSASVINIGSATGTTSIKNNLDVDGTVNIDGGAITTSSASMQLFNTTATNINAFGAATNLLLGAFGIGTTNVRNNLSVNNNLNVLGNTNFQNSVIINQNLDIDGILDVDNSVDILNNLTVGGNATINGVLTLATAGLNTTSTTFNLINTNATSINAFGAGTAIEIGSSVGQTSVNNILEVEGSAITTTRTVFNLLNTTATTVNFAGAATTINLGSVLSGTTRVRNDLSIDGVLILGGTTITAVGSSISMGGGGTATVNLGTSANVIVIGSASGTTTIQHNLDVDGDVNVDGGDFTTGAATFNLLNSVATTVNFAGAATAVTMGAATGSTVIRNNLQINESNFICNQTTFNLANSVSTTVNFAGAASAVNIGDNSGILTLRNPTVKGTQTTQNVYNTVATTVNAFGDAVTVNLGANSGTLTLRNPTVVGTQTTQNVYNTVATTVNAFGAATQINIGSAGSSGQLRINNDTVRFDGSLEIRGGNITVDPATSSFGLINTHVTTITAFNSAANIVIGAVTGTTTVRNNLNLSLGQEFRINTVPVLNATTLGSSVISSSLTGVGIISTGTWQGSVIGPTYGGTGVNNGTRTVTLGGNFATSGNFNLSFVLTGATSLTLPVTGTVAVTGNKLSAFASTTSAELATAISDETGSGFLVFNNSPTLVTPSLGVATATSINKVALTQPINNATLTIADGKTLAVNNSLTFSGTDGGTVVFGSGGTVAYTGSKISAFASTTSAELATVITDETGTGVLVYNNSPSLITPSLGAATATSINKVIFTAPATNSTITVKDLKTFTVNNTLTLTGIDGSNVAFGTGGTVAYTAGNLSQFASTTSAELAAVITDETGTGNLVLSDSPTLVTPVLGVASATSINKLTITAPVTAATLTIANNKTLTVSNTLTFTGTDVSSIAFGTGGTVAYTVNKLNVFAATTSSELAAVITDETGTGNLVLSDSPTLVTPVLGVASATSVSISSVITLTPLLAAPVSPTVGMIAVADNAVNGWNPAGVSNNTPYPVFYDGTNWVKITP